MRNYIIVAAVSLAIGGSLTYYLVPAKTITETKEVVKQQIVTQTHTIVRPDGTKEVSEVKTEQRKDTKSATVVEVKNAPQYSVSLGYNTKQYSELSIGRRMFGNVWLEVGANTNKELTARARIEF